MSRLLFTCLAMILTNAVIAHADFIDNGGLAPRIQVSSWTAVYAGTTEFDAMPVLAVLEKSDREISIPNFMADRVQTLVPLSSAKEASFRLTVVAQNQTNIRVSFPLHARTIVLDGRPVVSYFSEPRPGDQFDFVVTPREDGTLLVQYRREANETASGEFALNPLPKLL